MMSDLVLRQDEDGITTLILNRPEALNALSPALFVQLRGHIEAIARATDSVGCVVLRGEGRSFSAGNDLKAIQAGDAPLGVPRGAAPESARPGRRTTRRSRRVTVGVGRSATASTAATIARRRSRPWS